MRTFTSVPVSDTEWQELAATVFTFISSRPREKLVSSILYSRCHFMHRHAYRCNMMMTNFITKASTFGPQTLQDYHFPPQIMTLYTRSILQILHYMFIIPGCIIIKGCCVSLQIIFLFYQPYKGVRFLGYLLLHRVPLLSRTGEGFSLGLHASPEPPCQFPIEAPNRSLSRGNTDRSN